ncbi:MAG: hypothetical protein Q7R95_09730 [bacterium]|nr:hypothetical protein [bacterium]
MFLNIIGYPGSGKSFFINRIFHYDYYKHSVIDDVVFNEQKIMRIFEHTGHNSIINSFLSSCKEPIITIIIEKNILICMYRILFYSTAKINKRNKINRVFCCIYCYFNKSNRMISGLSISQKE